MADKASGHGHSGVLLTIHFTSNRPQQFSGFLDRLQEATSDPSAVEVVVKIDDTDAAMRRLLENEVTRRPFRVVFVSTPPPRDFYDLWSSYDGLLKAADPKAYFAACLNDEMFFRTRHWDAVLRKYVGLFPDHIFRLRTSPLKHRNYYDFWEAGFANDTSAIMTRRWLDLGGGWCPCNGPDSFQQCVAFYFGWLDRFNARRPQRELAIHDIELAGHGANFGLSGAALRRRLGGSIGPWFTLMSHAMQEEAARRAQKLRAHVWASENRVASYCVLDNAKKRCIEAVKPGTNDVLQRFSYKLGATRIWFTNAIRRTNYLYYGGGGAPFAHSRASNSISYLRWRYPAFDALAEEWARPVGILSYQVELLRRIYRDPAAASAIPGARKRRLYQALVTVFGIWPRRLLTAMLRLLRVNGA